MADLTSQRQGLKDAYTKLDAIGLEQHHNFFGTIGASKEEIMLVLSNTTGPQAEAKLAVVRNTLKELFSDAETIEQRAAASTVTASIDTLITPKKTSTETNIEELLKKIGAKPGIIDDLDIAHNSLFDEKLEHKFYVLGIRSRAQVDALKKDPSAQDLLYGIFKKIGSTRASNLPRLQEFFDDATPITPPTGPATPRTPPAGPAAGAGPTTPRTPPTGPATGPTTPATPPTGPATPPTGPATPPTGPATPPAGPATPPAGPTTPPAGPTTPPAGPTTPPAGPAPGVTTGTGTPVRKRLLNFFSRRTTPPATPATPPTGPTTPPAAPTTPPAAPTTPPAGPTTGPAGGPTPPPAAPVAAAPVAAAPVAAAPVAAAVGAGLLGAAAGVLVATALKPAGIQKDPKIDFSGTAGTGVKQVAVWRDRKFGEMLVDKAPIGPNLGKKRDVQYIPVSDGKWETTETIMKNGKYTYKVAPVDENGDIVENKISSINFTVDLPVEKKTLPTAVAPSSTIAPPPSTPEKPKKKGFLESMHAIFIDGDNMMSRGIDKTHEKFKKKS